MWSRLMVIWAVAWPTGIAQGPLLCITTSTWVILPASSLKRTGLIETACRSTFMHCSWENAENVVTLLINTPIITILNFRNIMDDLFLSSGQSGTWKRQYRFY